MQAGVLIPFTFLRLNQNEKPGNVREHGKQQAGDAVRRGK
jgi:hypothetical protein